MDIIFSAIFEYLFFRVGILTLKLISFGKLVIDKDNIQYWQAMLVIVFAVIFWGFMAFIFINLFDVVR